MFCLLCLGSSVALLGQTYREHLLEKALASLLAPGRKDAKKSAAEKYVPSCSKVEDVNDKQEFLIMRHI